MYSFIKHPFNLSKINSATLQLQHKHYWCVYYLYTN